MSTVTARTRLAAAAVLTGTVMALAPLAAQAVPAGGSQDISYLGYHFDVPGSWQVIDLATQPSACVRFDRHVLYLGTPSSAQNCPDRAVGRTEAMLVQPAAPAQATWGTTHNAIAREYDVAAARVTVTGTYRNDPNLIRSILTAAALPAAAPRQSAMVAPSARVSPSVALGTSDYGGYGFDACAAPSEGAMNAWRGNSPYGAVGIYIGGGDRACSQPNLSPQWMQDEAANGWHFIPIYVGPQANEISSPGSLGVAAANDAVSSALNIGLPQGTPLYYDMEAYAPGYSGTVLAFLSAWTTQLHLRGYLSGVYSSGASGITDLVNQAGTGYPEPDVLYDAHANGVASTDDSYVPAGDWAFHQRIHQYNLGITQTYGGVSINIDQDYLDVDPSNLGPLYYDSLTSSGYQGWNQLSGAAGASEFDASRVAVAGMSNGDVRMVAYGNDGNMYDNIDTNGTWQGWTEVQGVGGVGFAGDAVGIAAMPDGDAQLVAIGTDGNIWHDIWFANKTWQGWGEVQGAGGAGSFQASSVAIAGEPNGDSRIIAVGNDGNIYDDIRFGGNGNWQSWGEVQGAGGAGSFSSAAIAIAGMPDGDAQLIALGNDGTIWHDIWFANQTWQGWAQVGGVGTGSFAASAIAIAGMPDGDSQLLAVGNDGNVYHTTRNAGGTWAAWDKLAGANGASAFGARRVGITGLPDGSSYLIGIGG
jgi:hypothetical protein